MEEHKYRRGTVGGDDQGEMHSAKERQKDKGHERSGMRCRESCEKKKKPKHKWEEVKENQICRGGSKIGNNLPGKQELSKKTCCRGSQARNKTKIFSAAQKQPFPNGRVARKRRREKSAKKKGGGGDQRNGDLQTAKMEGRQKAKRRRVNGKMWGVAKGNLSRNVAEAQMKARKGKTPGVNYDQRKVCWGDNWKRSNSRNKKRKEMIS